MRRTGKSPITVLTSEIPEVPVVLDNGEPDDVSLTHDAHLVRILCGVVCIECVVGRAL